MVFVSLRVIYLLYTWCFLFRVIDRSLTTKKTDIMLI